jgi:hypothetical protein
MLSLSFLLLCGILVVVNQNKRVAFDSAQIAHDGGCAYTLPLDATPMGWPLMEYETDREGFPDASSLRLIVDGVERAVPHALHQDIREGVLTEQFSHWKGVIYFSMNACSDPRETRSVIYGIATAHTTYLANILILFALLFCANSLRILVGAWKFPFRKFVLASTFSLAKGLSICHTRINRSWILVSLLGLLVIWSLFSRWYFQSSVGLAVGGLHQISDATNYWQCANSVLNGGVGHDWKNWCGRRPLYPFILAGIAWFGFQVPAYVLFLQAALVSAITVVFLINISGLLGFLGGIVFVIALVNYMDAFLFGFTMSENLGFVLGVIAFGYFIRWTGTLRHIDIWFGVFFLACSLLSRPGPILVIFFLCIWVVFVLNNLKRSLATIAVSISAVASAYIIPLIVSIILGIDHQSFHGNFSYSLYGLSIGGAGWSQVLTDYPSINLVPTDTERSALIYQLATDNILANPAGILLGLIKGLDAYLRFGAYGFNRLGLWSTVTQLMWWVGFLIVLRNFRKPIFSLFLFTVLGSAISSPFIITDGGSRIFASVAVIDSVLIALSMLIFTEFSGSRRIFNTSDGSLLTRVKRWLSRILKSSQTSRRIGNRGIILSGALLSIFFIFSSFLAIYPTKPPFFHDDPISCKSKQHALLTELFQHGSSVVRFYDRTTDNPVKMGFSKTLNPAKADVNRIFEYEWWSSDAQKFLDHTIGYSIQLNAGAYDYLRPVFFFTPNDLASYSGKKVLLCLDTEDSQLIFGYPHNRVDSIKVLN